MARITEESLETIRAAARGAEHGSARVLDAQTDVRYDEDGAPYVLLVMVLAGPAAGKDTWPVEDVYEVRRDVRQRLAASDVEIPVQMSLTTVDENGGDEERAAPASGGGGVSS